MSLPRFPNYAQMLRPGFDEAPNFGVQRSEMDSGLAKQRPTRTLPITPRNCGVFFGSLADRNAFMDWVRIDLAGGSGWFEWPDPLAGNVIKLARIVGGAVKYTPTSFTTHQAAFSIETVG